MKLLKLIPDNFKGIKHFEFDPNGSDADIYGDNATGKTTVADAYFWLLFGKDSANSANFDILPEDKDGKIIEGLDASVTGIFLDESGHEFSLRRVYHQVFSRKNGEAEYNVKRNTTDFFINDIPKPMKDYTKFVSEICDEKMFMILTDPDMFAGKMKDDERRAILIQYFASLLDDSEIINAHEDLKLLRGYIGYKSVDEYAQWAKAQRKKINAELDDIPGRIDEAEKAKPIDIPTAADGPELLRLSKTKMKIENALEKMRNGENASELRKKISDLKADISQAKAEYLRKSASGNNALDAEAATLRVTIGRLRNDIAKNQAAAESAASMADGFETEIVELRQKCIDTASSEFNTSDGVCQTCGREYPPEQLQELVGNFRENNAEKLKALEVKGKDLSKSKANMLDIAVEKERQVKADAQSLQNSTVCLEQLTKLYAAPPAFETTEEYKKLQDDLSSYETELSTLNEVAVSQSEKFRTQVLEINNRMDAIKQRMTAKSIVERQDKRIAEHKARETELNQELATYDNGLRLAEKFTQAKMQDIEEKVNSNFQLVRWKLFDTQENGGIKACCRATVNGIEYRGNLNSAMKMNAGLDIINTLSRVVGLLVPVFMDNSEGIQKLISTDAQLIQTIVPLSYDKLGKVVQNALAKQYGSKELARAAYEAPNKQLRAEVRG